MDATEICPLTQEAIEKLLEGRRVLRRAAQQGDKRRSPRWPFPSPAELWLPSEDGPDEYVLATCENLGYGGVGIRSHKDLPIGQEFAIAIHQPEVSLHGRAIVRHSTKMPGAYYIGLEFVF